MQQLTEDKELIDELLTTNPDFKKLFEEHQDLKDKVANLQQKSSPDSSDELEIKRLKKLKLSGKDKMRKILSETKP